MVLVPGKRSLGWMKVWGIKRLALVVNLCWRKSSTDNFKQKRKWNSFQENENLASILVKSGLISIFTNSPIGYFSKFANVLLWSPCLLAPGVFLNLYMLYWVFCLSVGRHGVICHDPNLSGGLRFLGVLCIFVNLKMVVTFHWFLVVGLRWKLVQTLTPMLPIVWCSRGRFLVTSDH